MNLCSNAAHAMRQGGGVLTVRVEHVHIDKEEADKHAGMRPGGHIKLEVSDTGCGMPPEVADKIFEPFFTTKGEGEGTGMGLSVVHGIIKNHDGHISLASEPDQGTTFTILLPVMEAHEEEIEIMDTDAPLPKGTESILFVDDEEAIVDFGIRALAHLGYDAFGVNSSEEGLSLLKSSPQKFDLLITDMTMPRLTGLELAQGVHKIAPDLPIIICSGQPQQLSAEERESAGIKKVLAKPVTMRQMAVKVREVLDAS
jgi:CheY-like chemotaxis protein